MYYRLEVFVLLIPSSRTQFPCQPIFLSNLFSVLYILKCFVHCYNTFTLLFNKIIICRISSTETYMRGFSSILPKGSPFKNLASYYNVHAKVP